MTAVQPDAPTGLNATSGNAQVSLSWTAPSSNGGSSITGYNIYLGTATGTESGTPVNGSPVTGTSYNVTGLVNGIPYFFVVKAVNAAGESAASNEASATPVTVPDAPTGLSATSGNAQASLTWTAPSSDGGSPITGYNIYVGTTTGAESATPANGSPVVGTSYTVTGLANGTPYFFTVKAVNAEGDSTASNEVSTTPATVPDAPTGLSAASGNAQAPLTWTAPSSDGGSPITGYNIHVGTATGAESGTPVNGTPVIGTSYTVTGLINGTPYFFVVKAINAVGESVASNEASATPATVPDAPTGLSAVAGFDQLILSWTAPAGDGGSPITSYTATCTDGTNNFTASTTDGDATTVTITRLTAGTTYSCTVLANNAVGFSESSTSASATVPPPVPALSPLALMALALLLVGLGSWRIWRP